MGGARRMVTPFDAAVNCRPAAFVQVTVVKEVVPCVRWGRKTCALVLVEMV